MPRVVQHASALRLFVSIVALSIGLAGCAAEMQKVTVVQPMETKLTIYNALEVPVPKNGVAPHRITTDLHDKMMLQLGTMGKFRRVAVSIPPGQQNLSIVTVQATVVTYSLGSRFLRWLGTIVEFAGGIYDSMAKKGDESQKGLGVVSGSMGDGFVEIEFEFVDKKAAQPIGKLRIKGISEDIENFRTAEDRIVDEVVKYMKSRL